VIQNLNRRGFGRVMAAGVVLLFLLVGGTADAKKKSKIKQSTGRLVELNHAENTMTVRVKGKKVVFNVRFDGGSIVAVVPETVTAVVVTPIVATTELSAALLITMSPVPR
jgi:hypothetical protein